MTASSSQSALASTNSSHQQQQSTNTNHQHLALNQQHQQHLQQQHQFQSKSQSPPQPQPQHQRQDQHQHQPHQLIPRLDQVTLQSYPSQPDQALKKLPKEPHLVSSDNEEQNDIDSSMVNGRSNEVQNGTRMSDIKSDSNNHLTTTTSNYNSSNSNSNASAKANADYNYSSSSSSNSNRNSNSKNNNYNNNNNNGNDAHEETNQLSLHLVFSFDQAPSLLVYLNLSSLNVHRAIRHPDFALLRSLKVLIANDSRIATLERSPIVNLPLELLDLRHNLLMSLPSTIVHLAPTLRIIRLYGNPFVPSFKPVESFLSRPLPPLPPTPTTSSTILDQGHHNNTNRNINLNGSSSLSVPYNSQNNNIGGHTINSSSNTNTNLQGLGASSRQHFSGLIKKLSFNTKSKPKSFRHTTSPANQHHITPISDNNHNNPVDRNSTYSIDSNNGLVSRPTMHLKSWSSNSNLAGSNHSSSFVNDQSNTHNHSGGSGSTSSSFVDLTPSPVQPAFNNNGNNGGNITDSNKNDNESSEVLNENALTNGNNNNYNDNYNDNSFMSSYGTDEEERQKQRPFSQVFHDPNNKYIDNGNNVSSDFNIAAPCDLVMSLLLSTDIGPDQMTAFMAYFRDLHDLKLQSSRNTKNRRPTTAPTTTPGMNAATAGTITNPPSRAPTPTRFASSSRNPSISSVNNNHTNANNNNWRSSNAFAANISPSISRMPSYSEQNQIHLNNNNSTPNFTTNNDRQSLPHHRQDSHHDQFLASPSFTSISSSSSSAPRVKDDPAKRTAVISEILTTERTYLEGLLQLHHLYLIPSAQPSGTKDRDTIIPAVERKAVFSNVETLITFHKSAFVPDLERAFKLLHPIDQKKYTDPSRPDPNTHHTERAQMATRCAQRVAELFIQHTAYLKMYSQYISNFDSAIARLKTWTNPQSSSASSSQASSSVSTPNQDESKSGLGISSKQHQVISDLPTLTSAQRKRIKQLMTNARSNKSHTQLTLEAYLLLPVQRIPRYKLLLESLMLCTPDFFPQNFTSSSPNFQRTRSSSVASTSNNNISNNNNNVSPTTPADSPMAVSSPQSFASPNPWYQNGRESHSSFATPTGSGIGIALGGPGTESSTIESTDNGVPTPLVNPNSNGDELQQQQSQHFQNYQQQQHQQQQNYQDDSQNFEQESIAPDSQHHPPNGLNSRPTTGDGTDKDVESIYEAYPRMLPESRPISTWSQAASFTSSFNDNNTSRHDSQIYVKATKSSSNLERIMRSDSNHASMSSAGNPGTSTRPGTTSSWTSFDGLSNTSSSRPQLTRNNNSDQIILSDQSPHSPPGPDGRQHEPDPLLVQAVDSISALTSEMNERKRAAEGRSRLLIWQQRIGNRFKSPLVQPHRILLNEGPMQLQGVMKKKTEYAYCGKVEILKDESSTVLNRLKYSQPPKISTILDSDAIYRGETVRRIEYLEYSDDNQKLHALLCNDILILAKDPDAAIGNVELYGVIRLANYKIEAGPASIINGKLRLVDSRSIYYITVADPGSWVSAINDALLTHR